MLRVMGAGIQCIACAGVLALMFPLRGTAGENPCLANVENRQHELWANLKHALAARDGMDYFDQKIRDTVLPPLSQRVAKW